jgi:hypothetical protein
MGATAITFIALFAAIFGIFYLHFTTRSKERLALIEKGADASLFNTGKGGQKPPFNWNNLALKTGMFFMGIAIGLFTGATLAPFLSIPPEAVYFSMILFFGGLSLVLFFLIDRKKG